MSELSEPPCQDEYDTVNADAFLSEVEWEMLARGLTTGKKMTKIHLHLISTLLTIAPNNPYSVKPTYTFWSPWIGHDVRTGNKLFNTEHRKCHRIQDKEEIGHLEVSEDRLVELLHGTKVKQVKLTLCGSFVTRVVHQTRLKKLTVL